MYIVLTIFSSPRVIRQMMMINDFAAVVVFGGDTGDRRMLSPPATRVVDEHLMKLNRIISSVTPASTSVSATSTRSLSYRTQCYEPKPNPGSICAHGALIVVHLLIAAKLCNS